MNVVWAFPIHLKFSVLIAIPWMANAAAMHRQQVAKVHRHPDSIQKFPPSSYQKGLENMNHSCDEDGKGTLPVARCAKHTDFINYYPNPGV
jgi:hypothetical protein